jgi:hypothetical protein
MEEAVSLVRQCKEMLEENTNDIRGATSIETALNGPQGHVSARTVASVAMIDAGLKRLDANLQKYDYAHTNLLSCMTLDVENCHSVVHVKRANMSMAEYRYIIKKWLFEILLRYTNVYFFQSTYEFV